MRFFHKPGISPGHTLGMSQTFLRGNYCVSVLLTASFGKQGTALSCYSYASLFAVTGCAFDESRHLRYSAIQISHLPASFLHTRGIIRNAPGPLSPIRVSILPHPPIPITEKNLRTAMPENYFDRWKLSRASEDRFLS